MKRIALIPAYQPDELIFTVINDCEGYFDVIVVDDGSGEKFDSIFNKIPSWVHVIRYFPNKGKGNALRTGFQFIKEKYKDEEYVVVCIDDDGQHRVSDAKKVATRCEANPDSLVLGSRNFKKTNQKKSIVGNFFARLMVRIFTGRKIYDTQTGLRSVTNRNIDRLLEIKGNRYEYEINMLLQFSHHNIEILEEPIETIYLDNNSRSHYNPWKDTLRIFLQFIKFAGSSIIGFLVDYGMYALLFALLPETIEFKVEMVNICARVVSASVNFTINYFIVFKKKEHFIKYALKYFALAICILAINTLLLDILVKKWGWNEYASKLAVEAFLFIGSFLVQKLVVFKNRKKKNG